MTRFSVATVSTLNAQPIRQYFLDIFGLEIVCSPSIMVIPGQLNFRSVLTPLQDYKNNVIVVGIRICVVGQIIWLH